MADYVVVMYLGLVMEQGPVDDIFHAPEASLHPGAAALDPQHQLGAARTNLPTISGSIPHPFNQPRAVRSIRAARSSCPACAISASPALLPVGERQRVQLLPLSRTSEATMRGLTA